MSIAILLSFIFSANLISNIYIKGYKEPILFQSDQEHSIPSVILGKLINSADHLESQLKYDYKNNVIYALTYKKLENGVINDSTLYYSQPTDTTFSVVELFHNNISVKFSLIEVGHRIIVGYSESSTVIAISTDLCKNWKVVSESLIVKKIFISSVNSHDIAILTNLDRIYFLKDLGDEIDYQGSHVIEAMWLFVLNETDKILLYSGSETDRDFVRIGGNLRSIYNASSEPCIALETFENIPGLLIMNREASSEGYEKIFTAISFNHGVKWTHIIPPKYIDGKLCAWPSCYLKLQLQCQQNIQEHSIKFSHTHPSLMTSFGIIYINGVKHYSGNFVSLDVGYSWESIPLPLYSLHILDYGSILLGLPNKLNSFYYDLGHTWKYIFLSQNSLTPIKIFHKSVANLSLVATIITLEDITNELGFIKIDFSEVLNKDCQANDYEIYTPGVHKKSTCFQGQKGFIYRRKHDVKCRSLLDKLSKIDQDSCPCTREDFGCTFGYYSLNGQCLIDQDNNMDIKFDNCHLGEFVLKPSTIKKLESDVCQSSKKWNDQESDICKFTAQDNSISVLVGSTIKYTSLKHYEEPQLINLPIYLLHIGNIKSYSISFHLRCLYVLNETGIIQFCYNKRELAYEHSEEIFLHDHTILGMSLDQTSNNIFYYNKNKIVLINEISKYSKVIYKSQNDITYIKVFSSVGTILCSYTLKASTPNKYCVDFMSISGKKKSTLCYKTRIMTVAHDEENKNYFIYSVGLVNKVDYNYVLVEKKAIKTDNILAAYVHDNDEYFIIKTGILFGEKYFFHSHITHGEFHFIQKKETKSPCTLAHCDIFCFDMSSTSYECGCPDNMVFNKSILKCVCDSTHPHCTGLACKMHEFHCHNNKCIPISNRCNGVDNCEDSSDEKNCPMVCEIDELLCDHDSKCVSYYKICDGVKNCIDGKDELNCDPVSKCNQHEYRCLSGECIPKEKYCDGIKDCVDYSDEESCGTGCKYFEATCDNGQCVMKNQICDDNFDCSDLSDEHGCDIFYNIPENTSCLIKCDNKCIQHNKVCNHITDCSGGEDEIDCKRKVSCPTEDMLKCNSDFICYELFRKCDQFNDCPDGVDEIDCEKKDICSNTNIFKCNSKEKCISINDHCDGKYDCKDHSDEGSYCLNKNHIKMIKIKSMLNGHLNLIWVSSKKTKQTYKVSFIARHINKNLYLIECLDYENIIIQQFSVNPYFVVAYDTKLSCRVSACPINVFNISCSSFSSSIYLQNYSPYYKLKIAFIVITSFLFVAIIFYLLQKKLRLPFFDTILSYLSWRCSKLSRMRMDKTFILLSSERN
ncbi:hypothetical protein HZS_3299, partial [Henneguya salminicola]